jgi:hypothetical protein
VKSAGTASDLSPESPTLTVANRLQIVIIPSCIAETLATPRAKTVHVVQIDRRRLGIRRDFAVAGARGVLRSRARCHQIVMSGALGGLLNTPGADEQI